MTTPQPESPPQVPWSELGADFIGAWGRPDGRSDPEHVEITGQTGSGKSYLEVTLLQERALFRGSSEILIVTKQQDKTIHLLGWPVVDDWKGVQKYRQCIFWPRTSSLGEEQERHHEEKIYDLLSRLWQPDANVVIGFDEIGYVEGLPGPAGRRGRMKKLIRQYWREARSQGITLLAMKQRPIGVVRDQHSESRWKFVFPPADAGDMDRFAELLGTPKQWAPVLESLDQEMHQFVLRNTVTKEAYISWIDYPIGPIAAQSARAQDDRTAREYLHGRKNKP